MQKEVIKGNVIEFIENVHVYLINGVIAPSVSEVMKVAMGDTLKHVDKQLLKLKADRGTHLHNAISDYVDGKSIDWFYDIDEWARVEFENYKGLMERRGFTPVSSEKMLIVPFKGVPYCAGRYDMVVRSADGRLGLIDFKRRSSLERGKHSAQLNLYRVGLKYSYDIDVEFLGIMQFHQDIQKYVDIPINDEIVNRTLEIYAEQTKSCD